MFRMKWWCALELECGFRLGVSMIVKLMVTAQCE